MHDQQRVAELVRSFAAQLRPGDRGAAARGVAAAVRASIDGAPLAEAYATGRRAVRLRHPAEPATPSTLDLAS